MANGIKLRRGLKASLTPPVEGDNELFVGVT